MADDLPRRLNEAREQFSSKAYADALKTLAACPQDDPKVVHNTAMCQLAVSPGNYRATLSKLELPPIQKVKSLKTGQFTPTVVLQYGGQELAFLNAAAVLLHNGATSEARNVLLALANASASFTPANRMRVALMLHVAARRSSADVHDVTNSLLADASGADDDAAVKEMMSIAYSDTPGLHSWFARSAKTPMERALYLNNLGVEAFADGKAAVAGVFFARAAQSAGADGCQFVANSIAYNSAACALSRPGAANGTSGPVQALMMAQSTMSGSPMLWLRLGQALLDRFHDVASQVQSSEFDQELEARITALHGGTLPGFPAIPPQQVQIPAGAAGGNAIINAAAQALQNALALLVERSERIVDAARRLAVAPETAHVLDALLSMLAYVELTRGNYGVVVALATEYSFMERDVKQATCARTQAAMACYHVEALCASNRLSQALRTLQGMNLGHFIANKAPNSTVEALMVNVCVTYIMTGHWAKAVQLSQQLVTRIPSSVAQLLLAYLDLAQGNAPAAAEAIASLPQRPVQQS